jgi:hypothetical protein
VATPSGQGAVLQLCDCTRRVGQAAPPWEGALTTVRVLNCVPLPHGSEHVLQFDHADMTQSASEMF